MKAKRLLFIPLIGLLISAYVVNAQTSDTARANKRNMHMKRVSDTAKKHAVNYHTRTSPYTNTPVPDNKSHNPDSAR